MAACQADDLGQGSFAPDEARQLEREIARPPIAGLSSAADVRRLGRVLGGQSSREDVLVEATGVVVGLVFELAPQRCTQAMELGQRPVTPTRERVDAHQLAVCRLVQGLVDERLLQRASRRRVVTGRLVPSGEIDEQRDVPLAQRLPPGDRPRFEAIFGQKLAP